MNRPAPKHGGNVVLRSHSSEPLLGLLALLALAGCSGDLTLPVDGSPHELAAVAGDGQRGTVGAELPDPLIVQLVDAAKRPVTNVSVAFLSDIQDAQLDPATAATDDSGYASVRVRLGTVAGTQTVQAKLPASELSASFTLIATPPSQPGNGGGNGNDNGGSGNGGGGDDGHAHDHQSHGEGHGQGQGGDHGSGD